MDSSREQLKHGLTPTEAIQRHAEYARLWAGHRQIFGRLEALQNKIGYSFVAEELLFEALTHRSALMEFKVEAGLSELPWNERLEFLGDSVLGLAISRRLMQCGNELAEGELSKIRASLVNEESLAAIARELAIGEALLLGRGAHRSGSRERESLLADTLEAVIGAVFIDGGYDAADQLVGRIFSQAFACDLRLTVQSDHKTALQELMQERHRQTPTYEVTTVSGPDHDKYFEVKVLVGTTELGRGSGPSKKRASQAAAQVALVCLADAPELGDLR